jgi:flagellum-specific ATP synthase
MFAALCESLAEINTRRFEGRVRCVNGVMIEAAGPREGLVLGAHACITTAKGKIECEVVGFNDTGAVLMPFDPIDGLAAGSPIILDARPATLKPSDAWLGRVVDAFGRAVDGGPDPACGFAGRALRRDPPPANARGRMGARLDLGVRALNTFAPLCEGQRLGLFAGSGVGKSVLLSMLAKNADADVIVIGLIGERGREVREFVEDTLGPDGLARSVVVVATSDAPALMRVQAAYATMTVAEHFRDEGKRVLCLMDSVTRFALAQREIGLAAGEPPTTRGYTPSVFAQLPRLLERAGPGIVGPDGRMRGSITALFSVLVDGGDHDEPVADAVRGILDGHIVMDRAIAERGRYPAIDVLKSVSRAMPHCASTEENALIRDARRLMATYTDMEELIRIGAYSRGSNPDVDQAMAKMPGLEEFLAQSAGEATSIAEGFTALEQILNGSSR